MLSVKEGNHIFENTHVGVGIRLCSKLMVERWGVGVYEGLGALVLELRLEDSY